MIQGKAVQRLCVSPVAPRSRVSAVVRASSETRSDLTISRREAMLASVAAMSAPLVLPSPSYAGLFNDDDEVKEQYVKTTTDVLAKVQGVLALPKEPKEAKDAAVAVSCSHQASANPSHLTLMPQCSPYARTLTHG